MAKHTHTARRTTSRLVALVTTTMLASSVISAPAALAGSTPSIEGSVTVPANVGAEDMCIAAYGASVNGTPATFRAQVSSDVYNAPAHPILTDHTTVAFTLPVAAGNYVVEIADCDYSRYWGVVDRNLSGGVTKNPATATLVAAGTTDVHVILPDNKKATGAIRATLVDGAGSAVTGAVAHACPTNYLGRCIEVNGDAFGKVNMWDVPNGAYDLYVSSPNHLREVFDVIVLGGVGSNLGTKSLQTPTVDQLTALSATSGVVTNRSTDAPIQGATVTLLRSTWADGPFVALSDNAAELSVNATNPATTDQMGSFAFNPAPGFYKVAVSALGCNDQESPVRQVVSGFNALALALYCPIASPTPTVESTPEVIAQPVVTAPVDPCPTQLRAFSDVSGIHAHSISCLATLGVASGIATDRFSPGTEVSRGQVATFVVRTLDYMGVALPAGEDYFTDDDGTVHEAAINQLTAAGIVRGISATEFGANHAVTRAQMASIIAAIVRYTTPGDVAPAADHFQDDNGTIHENSINIAADFGLMRGVNATTFNGGALTTRAQLASLLLNVITTLQTSGI